MVGIHQDYTPPLLQQLVPNIYRFIRRPQTILYILCIQFNSPTTVYAEIRHNTFLIFSITLILLLIYKLSCLSIATADQ